MARGILGLLVAAALVGCGDGRGNQNCPGGDCSIVPAKCQRDSDCGGGGSICQADGTCSIPNTGPVASQCQNVTCPASFFCANGKCLPSVPQCKPADPTCIFIPHGAFEPPEHAWWWPFTAPLGPDDPKFNGLMRKDLEYPDFVEVMSTPVVMRLHPGDAEPAVVFNSFAPEKGSGGTVETRGVMRAIRGSDGSPIWSAPKDFWNAINVIGAVDGNASIAAGDCKGDGHVCFVTGGWDANDVNKQKPELSHQHGGLVAFDENGDFLWVNRGNPQTGEPAPSVWWGGPAMARLLPDSKSAQVVVGNGVYDAATGKTLCPQSFAPKGTDQVSGNGVGALSAIADIDLDGVPEIVTGNNAYKLEKDASSPTGYTCRAFFGAGVRIPNKPPSCPYGSTKSTITGQQVCLCPGGFEDLCPDGFPALASFAGYGMPMGIKPDDKHPQIVVATRGFLRIHDWTGGMVLNPIPLPASTNPDCAVETNMGGAPTIADFDGDGLPEVGIAAQGGYVVWKPGAGFIWQSQTFDCSSATGSSVFDFEGKGSASVVYSDQCYFRVYDGKTGATLVQEKNASCTAYETPIVADIDGSGRRDRPDRHLAVRGPQGAAVPERQVGQHAQRLEPARVPRDQRQRGRDPAVPRAELVGPGAVEQLPAERAGAGRVQLARPLRLRGGPRPDQLHDRRGRGGRDGLQRRRDPGAARRAGGLLRRPPGRERADRQRRDQDDPAAGSEREGHRSLVRAAAERVGAGARGGGPQPEGRGLPLREQHCIERGGEVLAHRVRRGSRPG